MGLSSYRNILNGSEHCLPACLPETRLYLSLTLVACDKVRLVDSTVFVCSSVVYRAFVALLYLWLWRDIKADQCRPYQQLGDSFPAYALWYTL